MVSDLAKPSRLRPHWLFRVMFGLCVVGAVGGVLLTAGTLDGRVIVLTAYTAGIAVALGLWWLTRQEAGHGSGHTSLRISFALTGGFAFYAIVSYALWAAGIPIELSVVRDGRMGEHFWLGPFALVYAVVIYVFMKWTRP